MHGGVEQNPSTSASTWYGVQHATNAPKFDAQEETDKNTKHIEIFGKYQNKFLEKSIFVETHLE